LADVEDTSGITHQKKLVRLWLQATVLVMETVRPWLQATVIVTNAAGNQHAFAVKSGEVYKQTTKG
jgi:hypothetical protein